MRDGATDATDETEIPSDRLTQLLIENVLQDHIYGYADKYGIAGDGRETIAERGIKHFVISRFNIWDESLRRRAGILEPAAYRTWLVRRIAIFNAVLLPTILRQTRRDFTFFLVLDTERDEVLDAFLESLAPHPTICPVFVDLRPAEPWAILEAALAEAILSRSSPGEIVATTRLDSDDALNVGFVDALHRYCLDIETSRIGKGMYLNFPLGVQSNGADIYLYGFNRNPFQTMLEPREKYLDKKKWTRKGVFQTAHNRTDKASEVVNINTIVPMWAQFVHGGNVGNSDRWCLIKLMPGEDLDLLFAGVLGRMGAVR